MKCGVALSTRPDSDEAAADVLSRVADQFGPEPADLAVVFGTSHHAEILGDLANQARRRVLGRHVIGCTAESVLGEDREVEQDPALCLWVAQMPRTEIDPVRLDPEHLADWIEALPDRSGDEDRIFLLFGDPFSFPADAWMKELRTKRPGLTLIGGMASGANRPGQNRLVLDGELHPGGAVGVLLRGDVGLHPLVSQGCQPIGQPLIVTRSDHNVIQELGRRPALEVLREQLTQLAPEEQQLIRNGLHIGRVINEYQGRFQRGDFLVRNVMECNENGLAISDLVRVGQTVQFHVRDETSADEDLRAILKAHQDRPDASSTTIAGALLFTCNGRGTRMFSKPHHDIQTIHDVLGPIPTAGFFALGEIGPIGGTNFLHGYTASILTFEEKSPTSLEDRGGSVNEGSA